MWYIVYRISIGFYLILNILYNYILMSLFIGNISRTASERDLEKAFEKFGDCQLRFRGAYGFIQFDNE